MGEMIRLGGTSLTSAVLVGADKTDESLGVPQHPASSSAPATWARDYQSMTTSVVSFQARRVARSLRPAEAYDRSLRCRVGLAWGLVFLNVLTFYKGTWNGLPLIVPIPSVVGKLMTQGALPAGLLVAWSANRRMLIRPSVFLSLLTLLLVEALLSGVSPLGHVLGTLYRSVRLGEFVATLWLLSPWSARRDLLLVKCQLWSLGVVLGSVLLGLMVSPHRALSQGRLSGEFWPITPVQVADFAAVALGWSWCSGSVARHPGAARWPPELRSWRCCS